MRLAFCIHTFSPVVGGSETLVGELARRLGRRGHVVRVFTSIATSTQGFVDPSLPRLAAGRSADAGVEVVRLPYRAGGPRLRRLLDRWLGSFVAKRRRGHGWAKMAWVGPHLFGLGRALAAFAPDTVTAAAYPFAHMRRALGWAKRRRRPYVAIPCLHPHDAWSFDNPVIESDLRRADAVLALTPYERDYVVALGADPARVHVLGAGTEIPTPPGRSAADLQAELGLDPDAPVVLFLGRKEEAKGVLALTRAARRLWADGTRLALVLAGPETAWSRQERAALTEGTDPRLFRYLEEVPAALRDDLLWHSDVIALPSHAESFGLVFLEAWARGKPVIGGRTGATGSLIADRVDGLLVAPGDADELAAAMRELQGDPELRARLGAAGRRKVEERFRWDRVVDSVEALYEDLATGRRHTAKAPAPVAASTSVVIVSYNGGEDVLAAIASAREAGASEVIVVDNGSADGTPDRVRSRFPGVRLLELSFNDGFAGGCNRGVRLAKSEFVVLLNQDATLDPGSLAAFAGAFDGDPGIGILAPRILVAEEPRVIQSAGLVANQIFYACDRGYLQLDGPEWREGGPVVGGSGAALALRRTMLDAIGLFDPALFMYYEDLDLCMRAWLHGWKVIYLPEAVARHRQRREARGAWHNEFLDHRNRQRLLLKHSSGAALARRAARELVFQARSLRELFAARRWGSARLRLRALAVSAVRAPALLTARLTAGGAVGAGGRALEGLLDPGTSYPAPAPPTAALGEMRPAEGRLDFSPAGASAFSLGWYPPERDQRGWYRWTGRYGLAFVAGADGARRLRLRAFSLADRSLDLWLGPTHLGSLELRGGEWGEHTVEIGDAPPGTRLLVVPDGAARPPGSGPDRRQLGVALAELAIEA